MTSLIPKLHGEASSCLPNNPQRNESLFLQKRVIYILISYVLYEWIHTYVRVGVRGMINKTCQRQGHYHPLVGFIHETRTSKLNFSLWISVTGWVCRAAGGKFLKAPGIYFRRLERRLRDLMYKSPKNSWD